MGLSTITPETRSEEFIDRIARALGSGGTSPLDTIVPETRHEEFIDRIARANGWTDVSPMASIYPETRMEEFLNRIADNAGGGGSLEIETGTITPANDSLTVSATFENEHTTTPTIVIVADATGGFVDTTNMNMSTVYIDYFGMLGKNLGYNASATRPAYAYFNSRASASSIVINGSTSITHNSDDVNAANDNYSRYWGGLTGFTAGTDFSSKQWKAGRSYKWVAIWLRF